MRPLPIILSRPHGGLAVPPEVETKLAIDQVDLYNDCDLWVDDHSNFQHDDLIPCTPTGYSPGILHQASMPIARALIDVNRPLEWLGKPDGPVKSRTSYGRTIYKEPLCKKTERLLLDRYWWPYHHEIDRALKEHASEVKLFIDCHNMAQHGPTAYRDAGNARPLICITNMGDHNGEIKPERGWTTCTPEFARAAAQIAERLFSDLTLLNPEKGKHVPVASLNWPFGGNFVIAHHLRPALAEHYKRETSASPPTSIMIEVNRGLFVGDQTAETRIQPPNQERIKMIRQRLYQWASELVALL